MTPIIGINGLSKSYVISHQREAAYGSLRDDIANILRRPFQPHITQGAARETVWALDGVSFDVQQGEIVGIIGSNGSGKSTLLKILSRITDPTKGSAILRGRTSSLLEVGTGFHPELTGRENIFLNGAILGMTKKEVNQKFDAIVEFSGVSRYLDTPVKFYSSGMYVRLAFSVAAHLEPEILIVDEVLSVGDAEFQKKSLGKMHSVSSEGRTVLFVSHNMAAVRTICNRAVVLRDGHLIFDGFPEAAIPYYVGAGYADASEFVRDPSLSYHKLFFKRITLRDSSGQRRANFVAGEDISVEVEVVVNESGADRELALELLNNEGVTLFTSTNYDEDLGRRKITLQPGTYLAVCVINTANIRPGQYVISLSSSKPGVEMFDEVPGAVGFQLDPAPDDIVQALGQNRRGMIYARFPWIMTKQPNPTEFATTGGSSDSPENS